MAARLRQLATSRMELAQTIKLDRTVQRLLASHGEELPGLRKVRIALLGSASTTHLLPGLRVAGLRRGLQVEARETPYGTWRQTLFDPATELHAFRPQAIVLALDARTLAALAKDGTEAALEQLRACWRQARERFGCQVIQQTALPVFPALLGDNEHRLPESAAARLLALNAGLRDAAAADSVDLLGVDTLAGQYGVRALYNAGLWHHAKQEVHPCAAALWGEHAARLVGAAQGGSAKCLVLDLDNTLWGGVIGDDGMNGIVLGQGSAPGEAYAEFQRYCRSLAARGVVLAVCSKNEEGNAREPFERHPEMLLHCQDIACFLANWTDKATNLREIARRLNLGLDALVFVDDNPGERELIRRELPEVHVPEMPEEPADFAATLAAAGYFEALGTTAEDLSRGAQYRANADRDELRAEAADLQGYLRSLHMSLTLAPVDTLSLARVTQLINKTNQFNIQTRRRTEAEVAALARDPDVLTLQGRLSDRFGDNGLITVVTARLRREGDGLEAHIEDWLMSCRVLGRRVEEACLQALVRQCVGLGVERIVGEFHPTAKNAPVRDLFASLGFCRGGSGEANAAGVTRWTLRVSEYAPRELPIIIRTEPGPLAAPLSQAVQQATPGLVEATA